MQKSFSASSFKSVDFKDFDELSHSVVFFETQNSLKVSVVEDVQQRDQLPVLGASQFKASMIWPIVKDAIGKDLTTISLPVFINEPLTTLQKSAELMYFTDEYFTKALKEEDSCLRMLYVATYSFATFFLIKGRT